MSFGGLTNYHLKLLAAATMVIDHVGVVFYPDDNWFRLIGRISFPLFVWLLVQGENHTSNAWRYGLRLAVLGIVSQPLYQIVLDANRPNILFQLLLGLICLRLTRRFSTFALPIWILGASIALLTETSYGAYGIVLTAMTQYFQPNLIWWAGWAGIHIIWALDAGPFQLPVIAVPALFWLANGKQGSKARWFYGFYPGHLVLLWLAGQQWP